MIFVSVAPGVTPFAESAAKVEPVATVNGRPLEGWELDRELAVRISAGSYHRQISEERKTELRCESLDELVLKELKRQWAHENPVDVDEAAEAAAWQEVRARFTSEEQYRAALETKGISEDAFRLAFHRDAVADAVDELVVSSVTPPTDTEVEVYLHHPQRRLRDPGSAPRGPHPGPRSAVGDRGGVAGVREHERASLPKKPAGGTPRCSSSGKSDLESLPPRFHDEVGDIGFVHRGSLLPAIDEAVFSAEVGEVIEPVKSIYGYHVLQVISTRPSQPIELAAVRAAVEERITREKRQRRLDEFEQELRCRRGRSRSESAPRDSEPRRSPALRCDLPVVHRRVRLGLERGDLHPGPLGGIPERLTGNTPAFPPRGRISRPFSGRPSPGTSSIRDS